MIMKKKGWISGLFLFLLVGISVAVRVYYILKLMGDVKISSTDIFLNVVYQILTIMITFFIVKAISNRDAGFGAGLVVSVLPAYVSQIAYVSPLNFAIFLGALVLAVVAGILRKILTYAKHREQAKDMVQSTLGIDSGSQSTQEDISGRKTEQKTYEKPQMDTSLKEIRLDDLEDSEELEDKNIQFIENPLPVPKRREHKEMDYAVEISTENDDFDLKDLSGKDFFDIE